MSVNEILDYSQKVIEYRPLWVIMIVISITQAGKMWLLGRAKDDSTHRLITRATSAATGMVAGAVLLEDMAGGLLEGAAFGLAISAAVSIAYVPAIKWLRKGNPGGWKKGLADWLSGK